MFLQHLVIDARRVAGVASQLGEPCLVVERPILEEAAAESSASLPNAAWASGSFPLRS